MSKIKTCKDCEVNPGRAHRRPAPHPGPRCATHHRLKKKADSERAAEQRWLKNYGITPEQYHAILAKQGGGCGFCSRPPRARRLAIDHDHSCCPGKTSCGACARGLLCWSCNKFAEHINDSIEVVNRMATYFLTPPAQEIRKAAA